MPRLPTSKKLTKSSRAYKEAAKQLPYWPSQEFLKQARDSLKEKGVEESEEHLNDIIHIAYWEKRAKILANLLIP